MVDLTTTQAFARFGLALVIGLLIGIQREYSFRGSGEEGGLFAGVRTFGLIGLLGATAAYLADLLDTPVPLLALIAIVGAFLMVTYFVDAWRGDVGLTTEIAALLVLLAGALAYSDQTAVASGIAVATAVLLSLKFEMRRFVTALTPDDVAATLKLAFISVIILPVLPNQTYDVPSPFNVLNPFKTWLLVVLISGISFVGYVLTKVVGAERGIALTGLVGGLASSTAVTLSFTERSQGNESLARPFALAVMLAWTVMFGRVVVAVAAVNPVLLDGGRHLVLRMAVPAVPSANHLGQGSGAQQPIRTGAGHQVRAALRHGAGDRQAGPGPLLHGGGLHRCDRVGPRRRGRDRAVDGGVAGRGQHRSRHRRTRERDRGGIEHVREGWHRPGRRHGRASERSVAGLRGHDGRRHRRGIHRVTGRLQCCPRPATPPSTATGSFR
jgi:uncharacterized membrane protein (DUF4010 family)